MKFYGKVGFVETVETSPGVWTEQITERYYYGDIIRDSRTLNGSDRLNDNFTVSNSFSILADSYAYDNFQYVRYIEYLNCKWKVTTVDTSNRPRLIISVNGLYNSPEEE